MTCRAPEPADLSALSGCAAELAEAFVSLASDIVLVIDAQGVITSVAQSPGAPVAADAGRWVGRTWVDTVSRDTRRKVELMLSDLAATGVARRREINLPGVGNGDVPVSFAALKLGAQGPVLAVGRDLRAVAAIQQRFMDAQLELERGYWRSRQADSRYRLLFQVATDAVLTIDAVSLRVIEANHAAAGLLGAGSPLAGRSALDLFDRSSRGLLQELLVNAGRSGKPAEIVARLPKPQAPAAVSATPFRSGDGQRLLLRVRGGAAGEAEALDLNRTLALLADGVRDGVAVTDSAGRVMVANRAFVALAGAGSEDEVRGHALGDWLGRIETDVSALLAGAHMHGIAHLVRSGLRRRDGVLVDVDVTGILLAEGEQECFGFTLRPCDPKPAPGQALAPALAALDDAVGRLPLPQLLLQATRLLEQRFAAIAMSRAEGDAAAAAATLGIAVEQLVQTLARAGNEPAETSAPL